MSINIIARYPCYYNHSAGECERPALYCPKCGGIYRFDNFNCKTSIEYPNFLTSFINIKPRYHSHRQLITELFDCTCKECNEALIQVMVNAIDNVMHDGNSDEYNSNSFVTILDNESPYASVIRVWSRDLMPDGQSFDDKYFQKDLSDIAHDIVVARKIINDISLKIK